jgi:hypothetical protein
MGWNFEERFVASDITVENVDTSSPMGMSNQNAFSMQKPTNAVLMDGLALSGASGEELVFEDTLRGSTFKNLMVDSLEPGFYAYAAEANMPTCDATTKHRWVLSKDGSSTSDCTFGSGTGSTENRCQCKATCSVATSTECITGADCPGAETCTTFAWTNYVSGRPAILLGDPNSGAIHTNNIFEGIVKNQAGQSAIETVSVVKDLEVNITAMVDSPLVALNHMMAGVLQLGVAGNTGVNFQGECVNPYRSGTRGKYQVQIGFYGQCYDTPDPGASCIADEDFTSFTMDSDLGNNHNMDAATSCTCIDGQTIKDANGPTNYWYVCEGGAWVAH